MHNWPEKFDHTRVLDVFAGTGALGLEAMSRGCTFGMFIENSTEGRALLRTNIEALGLNGVTKISRADGRKPGAVGTLAPFDLVFADPPYGKGLGQEAVRSLLQSGWLASGALLVLEEKSGHLPNALEGFNSQDQRRFADTEIGVFKLEL